MLNRDSLFGVGCVVLVWLLFNLVGSLGRGQLPDIGLVSADTSTPPVPIALITPSPATRPAPPPAAGEQLLHAMELLHAKGTTMLPDSRTTVEGEVRNVSDRTLKDVLVVIEWFSDDARFARRDGTTLSIDPLLPGQVASFRSVTTTTPEMKRFTVSFRDSSGGTIPTVDARLR